MSGHEAIVSILLHGHGQTLKRELYLRVRSHFVRSGVFDWVAVWLWRVIGQQAKNSGENHEALGIAQKNEAKN